MSAPKLKDFPCRGCGGSGSTIEQGHHWSCRAGETCQQMCPVAEHCPCPFCETTGFDNQAHEEAIIEYTLLGDYERDKDNQRQDTRQVGQWRKTLPYVEKDPQNLPEEE